LAKFLIVLQNYLAPGKLSILSFLAGAEQLVCRTPPSAASVYIQGGSQKLLLTKIESIVSSRKVEIIWQVSSSLQRTISGVAVVCNN